MEKLVLKLFKIVNIGDGIAIRIFDIIEKNAYLGDLLGQEGVKICINYEQKQWRTIEEAKKKWASKQNSIFLFNVFDKHDKDLFHFFNMIVSKDTSHKTSPLEFNICYNTEKQSLKELINLINNLNINYQFDWGYLFYLKKRQMVGCEGVVQWITGNFINELVPLDRSEMKVIEGFVPRLYQINLLNVKQFENLKPFIHVDYCEETNKGLKLVFFEKDSYKKALKEIRKVGSEYLIQKISTL